MSNFDHACEHLCTDGPVGSGNNRIAFSPLRKELAGEDPQGASRLGGRISRCARMVGRPDRRGKKLDATRTMNPDFLKNDADLQKISDCGKYLRTMLVSLNL
jgi:hypothetical protein